MTKITSQRAEYSNGQILVHYTTDDGQSGIKTHDEYTRFKNNLNTWSGESLRNPATYGAKLPSTFAPAGQINTSSYLPSQPTQPTSAGKLGERRPAQPVSAREPEERRPAPAPQFATPSSFIEDNSLAQNLLNSKAGQVGSNIVQTIAPELTGQVSRKGRFAIPFGSQKELPGPDASLSEVADAINHNRRQSIATLGRMFFNPIANLAQETSDTLLWDLPGMFGLGEATTQEKPNRGFLRVFPPLPYLKHENGNNEWEEIGTGFAQFGLGFATLAKGASLAARGAIKLTPAGKAALVKYDKLPGVAKGFISAPAKSAVVDWGGMDQYEGRFTDLANSIVRGVAADDINFEFLGESGAALDAATEGFVDSFGGDLANVPFIGYLVSNENDEGMSGRFKNVVEGIAMGALVDPLVAGVRTLKLNRGLHGKITQFNAKAAELDQSLGLGAKHQELINKIFQGDKSEGTLRELVFNRERRRAIYNGTAPEMQSIRQEVKVALDKVKDNSLWRNKAVKKLEAIGLSEANARDAGTKFLPPSRNDQATVSLEDSKNPITPAEVAPSPTMQVEQRKTGLRGLYNKTQELLKSATEVATAANRLRTTEGGIVRSLRRGISALEALKNQVQLSELQELENIPGRELSEVEFSQRRVYEGAIRKGITTLSDHQLLGLMELDIATVGELRYDQDKLQGTIDALKANVSNREAGVDLATKTARAEVDRLTNLQNRQVADLARLEEIGKDSKTIDNLKNKLDKPDGLRDKYTRKKAQIDEVDTTIARELLDFNRKKERGDLTGKRGAKTQEAFQKRATVLDSKKKTLTDQLNRAQKEIDDLVGEINGLEKTRDEKIKTYFEEQPDLQQFDPDPPAPKAKEAISDPIQDDLDPVEVEANNQPSSTVTKTTEETDGSQAPRSVTLESKKVVTGTPAEVTTGVLVGDPVDINQATGKFSFIGQRRAALPAAGQTSVTTEPRSVVIETPNQSTVGNLIEVRASRDVGQQLVNQANATVENGQLIIRGAPVDSSPYTKTGQRFWRAFYSLPEQQMMAAIDNAPEHLQRTMFGIFRMKLADERLRDMLSIVGEAKAAGEFIDMSSAGHQVMRDLILDAWRRDRWLKAHTSAAGRFILGRVLGLTGRFVAAEGITGIAGKGLIDIVTFAPGMVSPVFKATGLPPLEALGHVLDGLGGAEHWISHLNLFGLGGETDIVGKLAINSLLTRGANFGESFIPFLDDIDKFVDSAVGDWAKNNSSFLSNLLSKRKELRGLSDSIASLQQQRVAIVSERTALSVQIEEARQAGNLQTVMLLEQTDDAVAERLRTKDKQIESLKKGYKELFLKLPEYNIWSAEAAGRLHGTLVNGASYGTYLAETAILRALRLVLSPLENAYGALEIALSGGVDRQIGSNIQGDTLFLQGNRGVYDAVSTASESVARTVEQVIDPSITYTDVRPLTSGEILSSKLETFNNRSAILWSRFGKENVLKLVNSLRKWSGASTELQLEVANTLDVLLKEAEAAGEQILGPDGKPLETRVPDADEQTVNIQDPVGGFFRKMEEDIKAMGVHPGDGWDRQQRALDTLSALYKQASRSPKFALTLLSELISRGDQSAVRTPSLSPEAYTLANNLPESVSKDAESLINLAKLLPYNMDGVRKLLGPNATKADKKKYVGIIRALKLAAARQIEWADALQSIVGFKAEGDLKIGYGQADALPSAKSPDTPDSAQPVTWEQALDENVNTATVSPRDSQVIDDLANPGLNVEGSDVDVTDADGLTLLTETVGENVKGRWARAKSWIKGLTDGAINKYNEAVSYWEDSQDSPDWDRDRNVRERIGQKILGLTNFAESRLSRQDKEISDFNRRFLDVYEIAYQSDPASQVEKKLSGQPTWVQKLSRAAYAGYATRGRIAATAGESLGQLIRSKSKEIGVKSGQHARTVVQRSIDLGGVSREHLANDPLRLPEGVGLYDGLEQKIDWPTGVKREDTEIEGIFPDDVFAGPIPADPEVSNQLDLGMGTDTRNYLNESAEENATRAENWVSNRAGAAIINKGADIVAAGRKLGKNIRSIGKAVENKLPWQRKQSLAQQTQTLSSTNRLVISLEEGDVIEASAASDDLVDSFRVLDSGEVKEEGGTWVERTLAKVRNKVEEIGKASDQQRLEKEKNRRTQFLEDQFQREKNLSEKRAKEHVEDRELIDDLQDELSQTKSERNDYKNLANTETERANIAENKISDLEQKNSLIRQKYEQTKTLVFNLQNKLKRTATALTQERNLARQWENRAKSLDVELQKNKSETSKLKSKYQSSLEDYQKIRDRAIELERVGNELATKVYAEARQLKNQVDVNKARYEASQKALELKQAESNQWKQSAKEATDRANLLESSLNETTSDLELTRAESSNWEKLANDTKLERDQWEEKYSKSVSENEKLLQDIEALEQKNAASVERNTQLEAEKAKIQSDLDRSNNNIKTLNEQLSTVNSRSKEIESQLIEVSRINEKTIDSLRTQLNTEIEKRTTLEQNLKTINEQSISLEKAAAEASEANNLLKEKLAQTQAKKAKLEKGLKEINSRTQKLEQQVVKAVEANEKTLTDLRGQLSDSYFKANDLQQKLNRAENTIALQEADKAASDAEIARLKGEQENNLKKISSLESKLVKTEEALERTEQIVIDQNQEIIDLIGYSKEVEDARDSAIATAQDIRSQLKTRESYIIDLKTRISNISSHIKSYVDRNKEIETQLSDVTGKTTSEINNLKSQISSSNATIQSLEEQKSALQRNLDGQIEENNSLSEQMSNSLEFADAKEQELKEINDTLLSTENKLSDTELFLEEANRQANVWEQRATTAEDKVLELEAEQSSLTSRLETSEAELKKVKESENILISRENENNSQISHLESENQKLEGYKEAYQASLEELEGLKNKVTELENLVEEGQNQFSEELSSVRAQRDQLQNSVDELNSEISALQEGNTKAAQTISDNQATIKSDRETYKKNLTEQETETNNLRNELSEKNNELSEERQKRAEAESEVARLNSVKNDAFNKIKELTQEYKKNNDAFSSELDNTDSLVKELEKSNTLLAKIEEEGQDLKNKLIYAEQQVKLLQESNSAAATKAQNDFNALELKARDWANKYAVAYGENINLNKKLDESEKRASDLLKSIEDSQAAINQISEETGIPLAVIGGEGSSQTLQDQLAQLESGARDIKKQGEFTRKREKRVLDQANADLKQSRLDQWEAKLNEQSANKSINNQKGILGRLLFFLPDSDKVKRLRQRKVFWIQLRKNGLEDEKRAIILKKRSRATNSAINRANKTLRQSANLARRQKTKLINARKRLEKLLAKYQKAKSVKEIREGREVAPTKWQQRLQTWRINRVKSQLAAIEKQLKAASADEQTVIKEARQEAPRIKQNIEDSAEDLVDANESLDKASDNRRMPEELRIEGETIEPVALEAEASGVDVNALQSATNGVNGEQNLLLEGNSDARSQETGVVAPADDGGQIINVVAEAPVEDGDAVVLTATAVDESPEVKPERPTAGSVPDFPVSEIQTNPDMFQTRGGTVSANDTYRPQLAKELEVYYDADGELGEPGQTWLVNGHHRLDAAKRSNVDSVNVHYLPKDVVTSANDASIISGIQNVFDRGGKQVDGAKALRNPAVTPGIKYYIESTYGPKGRDAVRLARIPKSVFNKLGKGVSLTEALALGDRDLSSAVLGKVWNYARENNWSATKLRNAVWEINRNVGPGRGQEKIYEMFGGVDDSQINKRIAIRASIERTLKSEKNPDVISPDQWKHAASSNQVRDVMDEITPQMKLVNVFSDKLKAEYKTRLYEAATDYLENDLGIAAAGGTQVSEGVLEAATGIRSVTSKAVEVLTQIGKNKNPVTNPTKISKIIEDPWDETDNIPGANPRNTC